MVAMTRVIVIVQRRMCSNERAVGHERRGRGKRVIKKERHVRETYEGGRWEEVVRF